MVVLVLVFAGVVELADTKDLKSFFLRVQIPSPAPKLEKLEWDGMTRQLDNWLQAYAAYTDISEAPIAFNFWTGVTTIAGALRRQVYIDQIKFQWIPCFYTILVSPPGIVTKSSTINVGMNLLKQIDGVIVGPTSMTWQGLTKGFED